MNPLNPRAAIAVRPRSWHLLILPALALAVVSGCSHKRSAMRPVFVNPAPIVTTGAAPCPTGDPGCETAAPAPAFSSPGETLSPPSLPKSDSIDRQSGSSSDEPMLLPANPTSSEKPPALTGPSARRPSNRRSAVGPGRRTGARERVSLYLDQPNDLLLPPKADRAWQYIVLHHSDHATGSYAQIDRDHTEKLGTQGCGYHLVIGNGSESIDGQIEVANRWIDQKAGAHCRDSKLADANDYGIGICLIGDMDEKAPTARQIEATQALIAYLRERYEIPADHVVSHAAIAQTETSCPGKLFPVDLMVDARGFASR
jgi:hypothetical protein